QLPGDGCSADCLSDESCGNGIIDALAGEQCDDGNTVGGDGCNASCLIEACGNGVVDGAEVCDDGNQVSGDGCSADCFSDETCGNGYIDGMLGEHCDDANHRSHDGCSSGCTLESWGWSPWPSWMKPRWNGGFAFDGARNRYVVFGGIMSDVEDLNDTWESDGTVWQQVATPNRPPARERLDMVYDSLRGVTVLFGGIRDITYFDDTWEYDGTDWQLVTTANAPPPRMGHAMAFDPDRGVVVLFGGKGSNGWPLGDTWEYDGADWLQQSPPQNPLWRSGHRLVYDASRMRMVTYGGYGTSMLEDTWEYDGATWANVGPTNFPARRWYYGMAYDAVRHKVVLCGGGDELTTPWLPKQYKDTWEFDGTDWTEVTTPESFMDYRTRMTTFDTQRGLTAVFQPRGSGYVLGNWLQTYEGVTWTRDQEPTVPDVPNPMVYDRARGNIVLFNGGYIPQETWEFDGVRWRLMEPATTPTRRSMYALTYDSLRNRTLLFGGFLSTYLDDTWSWDGTTWTQLSPTVSPPPRAYHKLAYDSARDRVVLWGGREGFVETQDTWEFDGTTWQQVVTAHAPSGRISHDMAYDEARGVVVLFSGSTTVADTWEYDGTDWVEQTVLSPPAHTYHKLVYDSDQSRVVLFGKEGEVWAFAGADWSLLGGLSYVGEVSAPQMAYHEILGAMVLLRAQNRAYGMDLFWLTSMWPDEVCGSAGDEDQDGVADCADPDCDGLPCGVGQTCQSGICQ
ncbi:MAG: kelch repeat-containing protein, partial [bacterium]